MHKLKSFILNVLLSLLITTLFIGDCFAEENQNLHLKKNFAYLLVFDQKVEDYKVGSEKSVKVELINNIFNDKKQLVLTPISDEDTNIIVWTKDRLYNLDIFINSSKDSEKIIKFNEKDPQVQKKLGPMKLDMPPIAIQKDIFKLELDLPPSIN